ncbi:MAG: hypothetical protein ABJA79_08000 [Parafilimonas sp.]
MPETLNDIFAVIVLYKTSLENSCSFNSLLNAIQLQPGTLHVLMYNNSPEIKLNTEFYDKSNLTLTVINDKKNSGVSKAYNIASALAKKTKRKWLLLLDQDMQLPENFFLEFFLLRKKNLSNERLLYLPIVYSENKIVSPANYIPYRGFRRKDIKAGCHDIRKLAIINSGVLIDVALFKQAGGFNEEVGLDFSDVSFFRRLKQYNKNAIIMNVKCMHAFSGFEYDNYEKHLNRFRIFNRNALAFSKEKGVSKIFLFITVFLRAFNLSLKFKTFNFFREVKL